MITTTAPEVIMEMTAQMKFSIDLQLNTDSVTSLREKSGHN